MIICRDLEDRVNLLEKINEKLTYLQWVTAQSAGEQDIQTIYNILINGFEQICGLPKCVFFGFRDGTYQPLIVKNEAVDNVPVFCEAVEKSLDYARRERVAQVGDMREEGFCSPECGKCAGTGLQLCALYESTGNLFGVLCAYGENDIAYPDKWLTVLEFFSMQAGLVLENALLNQKLRGLSNTDALTGLYNHRYFYEQIKKVFKNNRSGRKYTTLVMLDVDNFKSYNDSYGHPEGDGVIKKIACVMERVIGDQGIACRYGGEEYAVIMPGVLLEEGVETAWRICRAVENCGGFKRKVTISAGVASSRNNNNLQDLIQSADSALYKAKARGKNRVCVE